jgi:hypothetical protein
MMRCRHCGGADFIPFLDLGEAPPSNSYLDAADLSRPEKRYPLVIRTCTECWLTQTEDFADREEFFSGDYAYFSSFSKTWLDHARAYVASMRDRFALGSDSLVAEVAANDGYLLQYAREFGIPCYGIEPTRSTAEAARAKGYRDRRGILRTGTGGQPRGQGAAGRSHRRQQRACPRARYQRFRRRIRNTAQA